jgi:hypothetical protein
MIGKDAVMLMYQTLRKDVPAAAEQKFESILKDVPKVMERRETFYGATEFSVKEPGGYVVCFSEHKND